MKQIDFGYGPAEGKERAVMVIVRQDENGTTVLAEVFGEAAEFLNEKLNAPPAKAKVLATDLPGELPLMLGLLLLKLAQHTEATWEQHLRYEFGDERAEPVINSVKAILAWGS